MPLDTRRDGDPFYLLERLPDGRLKVLLADADGTPWVAWVRSPLVEAATA